MSVRHYSMMLAAFAFSSMVQVAEIAAADTPAVPFITGGIGDEMDDLVSIERDYDLKLLLTANSGAYLADVNVRISDSSGNVVLETVTEGPVLLVKLPQGNYTVTAEYQGHTQHAKVVAGPGLHSYQMRFDVFVARN